MRPENLILLLLMGGVLYLMFSRTRKQQREMAQLQASLSVGMEIMTASGMYATVVELDDQAVVLESAPGQRARWDRRAVARVISSPATGQGSTAATGGSDDGGEYGSANRHDVDGTDEGAGARLEHGETRGDSTGPASSAQDTAPPDRP